MSVLYRVIQEERSVLGGSDSIAHCEKKNMNMCIILNGYQDRAVSVSRPDYVRFLFVGLDEEESLQKKGGYTRRIARLHFGCCCLHKET